MFLALLVPAWAAGRSPLELLLIYPAQAGQYERLTLHAPSALAWIPDTGRYFDYFNSAGLILAAAAALGLIWVIYKSPAKLTAQLLIELALISVVLMPFCLPRMHERYFYLADVLSIIVAFLIPSLFYVPVADDHNLLHGLPAHPIWDRTGVHGPLGPRRPPSSGGAPEGCGAEAHGNGRTSADDGRAQ